MAFDPNSLSNEDLMAIAGPPSGGGGDPFAHLSNDDLAAIAGPPDPQKLGLDESFSGRFKNNLVAAANTVFPFADEGAAGLRSLLPGYGSYDEELAAIRQGEKDYAKVHPYQSGASSVVGALASAPFLPSAVGQKATLAGKVGQSALEGAGYGAYFGFGSGEGGLENRANLAEDSAIIGGLLSPAITGTLGGVSALLGAGAEKVRPPTAEEEMIQGLRITPADFRKAGRFKSELEAKVALTDALEGAKSRGVFTGESDIGSIAQRNDDVIEALGKRGDEILAAADKQGTPALAFDKARAFIAEHPFEEDKLLEQFQRRMAVIGEKWDGTVSGLNKLKRQIGRSAFVSEADSKAFDRVLYSDLRATVERGADQLGGDMGTTVRELNRQLGQHYTIGDILERAGLRDAAAEVRAPKQFGLASLPTLLTGGGLASAYTGDPTAMALAGGLALARSALNSKPGAAALSGALDSGAGLSSALATLGDPRLVGDLAASVTGALDQDRTPGTSRPRPTAAAQKTSPKETQSQSSRSLGTELVSQSSSPNYPQKPQEKQVFDALYNAVKKVESSDGKNLVGPETKYGTAKGPVQLLDDTGRAYHKKLGIDAPYDPFDEGQSRAIFEAKMRDLLKRYGGDLEMALLAYHSGEGTIEAGKVGPIGRAYPGKVFAALRG